MFAVMRTLLFLTVALTAVAAHAAETAYTALRVMGKQNGSATLDRVVEVRGRAGAPSPEVWKIVLDDPRARGGVREIEVQRGRIIGERSPTARPLNRPMNCNQLNLDSEGAFTIANQEAQKAGVPFQRVDYTLKAGTASGAPVWQLDLFDDRGRGVGSLHIAADTGAILRQELASRGRVDPREDDRAYVEDGPPHDDGDYPPPRSAHERDLGSGLPGFLRRVGRHFERRGRQLENFFTGRGGASGDRYDEDR
jgi:hypothetical protein